MTQRLAKVSKSYLDQSKEAGRDYEERSRLGDGGLPQLPSIDPLQIAVRNQSGEDLPRGAPVDVNWSNILTTPERGKQWHDCTKVVPGTEQVACLLRPAKDGAIVPAQIGGAIIARVEVQNTDHEYAAVDRTNSGTAFVSVGSQSAGDARPTTKQGRTPILKLMSDPDTSLGIQNLSAAFIQEKKQVQFIAGFSGSVSAGSVIPLSVPSGAGFLPPNTEELSLASQGSGNKISSTLQAIRGVYRIDVDFSVTLPVGGNGQCQILFSNAEVDDMFAEVPLSAGTFNLPMAATRMQEIGDSLDIYLTNNIGTRTFTNGRLSIQRIGDSLESNA